MFAEKWHAEGTEQKPGFLIVGRRCADHDGDARNHFGGVSNMLLFFQRSGSERGKKGGGGESSRIVIDLNLGKGADNVGAEAKGQVAAVVATAATDSPEIPDARHDHFHHLGQEAPHVFSSQFARHRRRFARLHVVSGDRFFGSVDGAAHVGDGLNRHARHGQESRVGAGPVDPTVHRDFLQRGHIAERDGAPQQIQGRGAAGRPQRSVFEVRRRTLPTAQALGGRPGERAGGVMLVEQGEEVRRERTAVCLLKAGEGEGAGYEEARGGVGRWRRLMWVQGATIVSWAAVLVAASTVSKVLLENAGEEEEEEDSTG